MCYVKDKRSDLTFSTDLSYLKLVFLTDTSLWGKQLLFHSNTPSKIYDYKFNFRETLHFAFRSITYLTFNLETSLFSDSFFIFMSATIIKATNY